MNRTNLYSDKVAFFIGAGASIFAPSWLPLADNLKENIFNILCNQFSYKINDQEHLLLKDFPLEFLLQVLKDIGGEQEVLNALNPLKFSYPNFIHHSIAYLAKKGICDVIITVNFDTLLEQALEFAQCKYRVFAEDSPPSIPIQSSKKTIYVYKFHGTISNPKSLFATLDRVGCPLSKHKTAVLQRVLKHRKTIFLGYRGADVDIKPHLIDWLLSKPKSYIWNSLSYEGIDDNIYKYLSKKNLALCDGIDFINDIINEYKIIINPAIQLNSSNAIEVVCRIFGHLGSADSVIKLMKKTRWHISNQTGEILSYFVNIFRSELQLGNLKKAKYFLNKAKKTLKENHLNNNSIEELKIALEHGKFLICFGDMKGIKELHNLLELFETRLVNKNLDWYHLVLLQILIENYPEGIREGDDPFNYIKIAKKYAGNHVQLRGVVLRTEAIFFSRIGNYKKAIELFSESLEHTESTADNRGQLILLLELSRAYHESCDLKNAINSLKKADCFIEHLENLGVFYPWYKIKILEEKSIVYKKLDKKRLSQKYKNFAKQEYLKMKASLCIKNFEERLQNI